MPIEDAAPLEERLVRMFKELGIERVHVAGRINTDWQGLAAAHPDRVASLSMLCPMGLDPRAVARLVPRLLVVTGGRGAVAERVQKASATIAGAPTATLHGYDMVRPRGRARLRNRHNSPRLPAAHRRAIGRGGPEMVARYEIMCSPIFFLRDAALGQH